MGREIERKIDRKIERKIEQKLCGNGCDGLGEAGHGLVG